MKIRQGQECMTEQESFHWPDGEQSSGNGMAKALNGRLKS